MSSDYDWSVLSVQSGRVATAIERIASTFESTPFMDADDLIQYGQERTARVDGNLYELALSGDLRLFSFRLRQDFIDKMRPEWKRANNTDSHEVEDHNDDNLYYEPRLDLTPDADYTEQVIHAVLPALWDESYAMRLDTNPFAPDSDMPKGKGGRISSPAHWDLIADVRRAWFKGGLTDTEKRSLFLTVGLGMSLRSAAAAAGVSYGTVRLNAMSGMGKLANFLEETEN